MEATQTVTTLDGSDMEPGGPVRATEVLEIYNDGPGRLPDSNAHFIDVLHVPSLAVRNEIVMTPRARTDPETIVSVVNNYFIVPEPAAAALQLCAAPAFLRRRRRADVV